jgi:uncharacterized protein (DUF433 family)
MAKSAPQLARLTERLGGPPAVRYPVQTLLELLASGMTLDEVLADYPDLARDDLLAALEFGALTAGGRRVDRPGPREAPCRPQLPARLATLLNKRGHEAIHTSSLPAGNRSTDQQICAIADAQGRIVVTKDADSATATCRVARRAVCSL